MTYQINREVQIYNTLKERIKNEFELYEDDPFLHDTVGGEVSLADVILTTVREIRRTEAFASALKFLTADNNARLSRFEAKTERLRRAVAWALQETGQKKMEAPDVTISQRDGERSVIITNEAKVPQNVCNVKYIPSKNKIRELLEAGQEVPGAEWSNGQPILTIRTR